MLGGRTRAIEISEWLPDPSGRYSYGVHDVFRAEIAALLGDREGAIRLLRQALAAGYPSPGTIHQTLAFESIRDEPEFRELLHPRE